MYAKYNAVLRAESGDAYLVSVCAQLTQGNKYTTTMHTINSAVVKLSKVTTATRVYRGIAGGRLPASFQTPNECASPAPPTGDVRVGALTTEQAMWEAPRFPWPCVEFVLGQVRRAWRHRHRLHVHHGGPSRRGRL